MIGAFVSPFQPGRRSDIFSFPSRTVLGFFFFLSALFPFSCEVLRPLLAARFFFRSFFPPVCSAQSGSVRFLRRHSPSAFPSETFPLFSRFDLSDFRTLLHSSRRRPEPADAATFRRAFFLRLWQGGLHPHSPPLYRFSFFSSACVLTCAFLLPLVRPNRERHF